MIFFTLCRYGMMRFWVTLYMYIQLSFTKLLCHLTTLFFHDILVERARRLFIDAKIRELGLLLPQEEEA